MNRLVVSFMVLFAAPAAAEDKQDKEAVRDLVKDAMAPQKKPEPSPGPDVSKMPFTADSIRIVVSHHQPQIQDCYEETMASKEKVVEGKLMTSFTITPEGLVKSARVDRKRTTLKEPKLHDCVVAVLTAMTFPKPADGKDHPIEYPFNLKAIK